MSNLALSAAPFSLDSDNNMENLSGGTKSSTGTRLARNHIERVQKRTIKNRQPVDSKVDDRGTISVNYGFTMSKCTHYIPKNAFLDFHIPVHFPLWPVAIYHSMPFGTIILF